MTKTEGIEKMKDAALKNGNGVYIIYADFRSSDAAVVFTVFNGVVEHETSLLPSHRTIKYQLEEIYLPKHQNLNIFIFLPCWFTWPNTWRNNEYSNEFVKSFFSYLSSKAQYLSCDLQ